PGPLSRGVLQPGRPACFSRGALLTLVLQEGRPVGASAPRGVPCWLVFFIRRALRGLEHSEGRPAAVGARLRGPRRGKIVSRGRPVARTRASLRTVSNHEAYRSIGYSSSGWHCSASR